MNLCMTIRAQHDNVLFEFLEKKRDSSRPNYFSKILFLFGRIDMMKVEATCSRFFTNNTASSHNFAAQLSGFNLLLRASLPVCSVEACSTLIGASIGAPCIKRKVRTRFCNLTLCAGGQTVCVLCITQPSNFALVWSGSFSWHTPIIH